MARSHNHSYPHDPILQFRPPFVHSLPVQILLTGITLTLATVLLLHLLFTAQYHWPLARTNCILQITGAITLVISTSATLYVILSTTMRQSQHWPYMLSYLAVQMPASNHTANSTDPTLLYRHAWTPAEMAAWVVMNATTSVVVQLTHIDFLTLLFPSDLEARLIFSLLGPLAIISAVMQLLPLVSSSVASIAEDTRNVCNAALSVLFTSFLIIWGFFINRRQAWRTDGGTAAFGAGAVFLALISTSLNFLYIPRQEQYTWMPNLMWVVTLWQSFFGWWWWAGAGVRVHEVEELLQRENKRQQKRLLRAKRRKEQHEKAKSVWKGVTETFKLNTRSDLSASDTSNEPTDVLGSSPFMQPVQMIQRWFACLRYAHLTAAHIQATERAERLQQVYQREEARNPDREYRKQVVRRGLGSLGMGEAEREQQENIEMEVQIPREEDEEEWRDVPMAQDSVSDRRLRYRGASPVQQTDEPVGSSIWWSGPLQRWRLKDSTTYR